jgi:iduronate 2-sulfatase
MKRILCLSLWLIGATLVVASETQKPNVLMILVDDLKPTLGCYGDGLAKSPNIDRLASRGMRFDLAYCNQAVCAPSRFTLMLGSHSTSTGLYGLGSQLRERVPNALTLPQIFAQHGYRTESLGKVFHIGHGNQGDPASFSVEHFHDKVIEYADPASTDGGQLTREEAYFTNQQLHRIRQLPRGAAFESPDVPDTAYADGRVAAETAQRLQAARQRRDADGTPFFIVAGFARPHLPFSAPRKYWDLYDPEQFAAPNLNAVVLDAPPRDAPQVAHKTNGELANYTPVPDSGKVDAELRRQLTHGYYASVSFVDAQIGKVLEELDRQQLTDNTIVVLWGDHGFHLGDHGYWTKHTNYEQANRIPLLIAAPGVTQPATATRQLAESVDILPTLVELAGLVSPLPASLTASQPQAQVGVQVTPAISDRGSIQDLVPQPIDGHSLVTVLREPSTRVRDHAYHVFPKAKLGRAIRTERYRFVEWRKVGEPQASAEFELYDYELDPQESHNLAAEQPQVVAQLRSILATYPAPVDPSPKSAPKARPNIVMVFIDDMGWQDFSCFGNTAAKTPNIDRLAAEGMRFEQFYVNAPICSPSRCALTTGQYPQRWQITSYLNNRADNGRRGVANWLDPQAPTLARILQKNGYATGHFGKWHLGGQRDVDDAPPISAYGFDESLTNFEGMGAKLLPMTLKPGDEQPGRIWGDAERLGGPVIWMQRSEITAGFVNAAVPFIKRASRTGFQAATQADSSAPQPKPFYINLWPDDVHGPYWPPVETWGDGSKRRLYLSVLEAMDRQLGTLFDTIHNDPTLRDNTLILICSDNGPDVGAGSAGPFRGSKATLYEGGVRSPLIVWGPGWMDANQIGTKNESSIFSAIDLVPSLLSIAGIAPPATIQWDGENLATTLLGQNSKSRVAPLFWRRPPDRKFAYGAGPLPDLSIRDGDWKLLCDFDGGQPELYNLAQDPSESTNLAEQQADTVARLTESVRAWNATMPQDNAAQLIEKEPAAGKRQQRPK